MKNDTNTSSTLHCHAIQKYGRTFLDGELEPSLMIEWETHIEQCVDCRTFLEFQVATKNIIKNSLLISEIQAPVELRKQLVEKFSTSSSNPTETSKNEPSDSSSTRYFYAAAAVFLLIAGGLFSFNRAGELGNPTPNIKHAAASLVPAFEDIVQLHTKNLPPDISAQQANRIPDYFNQVIGIPVRPALFEAQPVQLVGARVSSVRAQKAAALYYNFNGHKVTVVVFNDPGQIARQGREVHFQNQKFFYNSAQGYVIPLRHHAGLTYAITGDLDENALLGLAASLQVRY